MGGFDYDVAQLLFGLDPIALVDIGYVYIDFEVNVKRVLWWLQENQLRTVSYGLRCFGISSMLRALCA